MGYVEIGFEAVFFAVDLNKVQTVCPLAIKLPNVLIGQIKLYVVLMAQEALLSHEKQLCF